MTRLPLAALALFGALALASTSSAQAPQIIPYGIGCMPTNGNPSDVPSIGTQGLPQIGTRMVITYRGPNHTVDGTQSSIQPFLMLGLTPQNTPIPPLFFQQPMGCALWVTPDFLIPMTALPQLGRFDDALSLDLPPAAALVGGLIYAQWFALHEQCGFVGCDYTYVITSDALNYIIGV